MYSTLSGVSFFTVENRYTLYNCSLGMRYGCVHHASVSKACYHKDVLVFITLFAKNFDIKPIHMYQTSFTSDLYFLFLSLISVVKVVLIQKVTVDGVCMTSPVLVSLKTVPLLTHLLL